MGIVLVFQMLAVQVFSPVHLGYLGPVHHIQINVSGQNSMLLPLYTRVLTLSNAAAVNKKYSVYHNNLRLNLFY
jgi:hypothetical protein